MQKKIQIRLQKRKTNNMNFYPYIKTRAVRAYYRKNRELILGVIFIIFLVLTLGIVGKMEFETLKAIK